MFDSIISVLCIKIIGLSLRKQIDFSNGTIDGVSQVSRALDLVLYIERLTLLINVQIFDINCFEDSFNMKISNYHRKLKTWNRFKG